MNRYTAAITSLLFSVSCLADDVNLLDEIKKDNTFKEFLASLNKAVNRKDANFVHKQVSKSFYLHRDFGRTYNKNSSNIENFGWAFQLDNTKLREEHKDHGWKELKKTLVINNFEYSEFTNHEICGPAGALEKQNPEPQLCFTRNAEGKWLISSYIFGGD